MKIMETLLKFVPLHQMVKKINITEQQKFLLLLLNVQCW